MIDMENAELDRQWGEEAQRRDAAMLAQCESDAEGFCEHIEELNGLIEILVTELQHLVKLIEPHEHEGRIPGLATLNGARAAIAKAKGDA